MTNMAMKLEIWFCNALLPFYLPLHGNRISLGVLGGEEFILILKEQNLQQAIEIAERCRKIIEQEEIQLETKKILKMSASFGVALSQSTLNKEQTIRMADRALYLAKRQGRNQVRNYLELNLDPAI
ncbi:GGDEF domain-containing protein [Acinetobacter sp. ANC 4862]|nr:GGDEF domain-containing protein [Acinetobacter sp. ANC 4862]